MRVPASPDASRIRRLTPNGRILLFSAVLAACALALYVPLLRGEPALEHTPLTVSFWVLVVLFTCSELLVVHLETRGDAHAVTFSEIPMVVALVLASPANLVAGRLVGAALALGLHRRQSPIKLLFNLAMLAFESSLAIVIYRAVLGDGDPIEPIGWIAALLALLTVYGFSATAVTAVITMHSGFPGLTSVRRVFTVGSFACIANTCIGLGVTGSLYQDTRLAILVSVVALVLYLVSHSYMALAQRYAGMQTLQTFTRTVGGLVDVGEITTAILGAARELLRAERALLGGYDVEAETFVVTTDNGGTITVETLDPQDVNAGIEHVLPTQRPTVVRIGPDLPAWLRAREIKDAAAVPLRGDAGLIGLLVVANRLASVSTFKDDELALFETFANHAGVALDNGRLFARLNREVADRTYQALHDALTGLPNRELLDMRLSEAIATADRAGTEVAVLLLDLEGFKEVNDTLGHHTGDLLLRQVATSLRQALSADATLARFGGDEFVVVAPVASRREATAVADEMIVALSAPFTQGELSIALGANVGVALFPEHGLEPATLLQRADVAMYSAKAAHAGYDIYSVDRDPFTSRRLALVGSIREAIGREEIEVFYQPQIELSSGLTVAAEGLVRWRHPELGLLPPQEFVFAVEQTNIIQPLTRRVLQLALDSARQWRTDGYEMGVAVNLSVRSLLDPALPGEVLDALVAARFPAEHLTLEITENSVMTESRRLMGVLSQLREMGVRLSIDDFGTGYSSLAHLRRIPVSEIKVDKSFVRGLTLDNQDAAIVRSTIELGHQLGLRVVAEGVESQDALDRLREYGCDAVQGFAISRPRPPDNFTAWLADHRVARLPSP